MRNSLIIKLMGAFLLVSVISALVISLFTSFATRSAFSLYTTRTGRTWAQSLSPVLAEYYSANQGWQGVETLLQSELSLPASLGAGSAQGEGHGAGAGRQGGIWTFGQRVILADAGGSVVYDSAGELGGQTLSASELENGTAILVDSIPMGTVLVTPNDFAGADTPAGQFLASVNRALILSVAAAGVLSLLLGAALFLQITAPLRQMNRAAAAIARGDLSQRVDVRSKDELGRLGQTFNQMAGSLERSQVQRQHLMADIAHELRTPIAVIQANLEAMLDEVIPLDAGQVAALHDETLLLNRLVGDLRLLSLAEAGELKLEKRRVEIGPLISQVVERLRVQAQQNEISLELEIPDELPAVWMDADRITQVLSNLIGNALRYTPPGGRMTIRAARSPMGVGSVTVSITDTGPGIQPDALPFVFDRFYRADQSRERSSGGSGLGLAIVKQLIEAHGGTIRAESPVFTGTGQPAFGTRFTFTLPLQS